MTFFRVLSRLKEFWEKICYPATKSIFSKKNKASRLAHAEDHVIWNDEDLSPINLRDENNFMLVGSDGWQCVWRPTGDKLKSKCVEIC